MKRAFQYVRSHVLQSLSSSTPKHQIEVGQSVIPKEQKIGKQLIDYLSNNECPSGFRISKQTDGHYIVHPINQDGETIDLKWNEDNTGGESKSEI